MFAFVILLVLLIGVSTILWTTVGLGRVIAGHRARLSGDIVAEDFPDITDVAVVIAAHNEELIIGDTLRSLEHLVDPTQVFVVSDGSRDRTAQIAREHGANVLELLANRGKAGAIVEVIESFDIPQKFEVVLLLDADTQLTPRYFDSGLPLFRDSSVVAVAGRASSLLGTRSANGLGRLLVDYRNRVYIAMQYLFKFGQAARSANVVAIVPGFASMYRTRILGSIDIAAAGLKIEDYNMTFEIHAKKLGRIAFHPHAAVALTQDPDHLHQYVSQVVRWNLGFWQTVIRHPFRFEKFWLALWLFIVELMISSVLLILFLPALILSLAALAVSSLGVDPGGSASFLTNLLPAGLLILGLYVPDYFLTILAAVVARRPHYLLLGLVFPLLRILDAFLCVRALCLALDHTPSHGRWDSPERRRIDAIAGTPNARAIGAPVPVGRAMAGNTSSTPGATAVAVPVALPVVVPIVSASRRGSTAASPDQG
jgi:cellulose synthase/poly-beta-1,6-N-acetylglucosamine synthase-like glycosyltransferase